MKIDLFTIGNFTVHGYGLMIGLGFLIAYLVMGYRAKKYKLNDDYATTMAILVLVFGFMGGKLLYILVEFKDFLAAPLTVLGSEGFVVYGGIITGILTIFIYCKIKKIDFLSYIDLIAPSVAINQALGRVGCFLAGCCYGRHTDSFIGVVFPEGSLAPAGIKLLPTQLFSAGADMALAVFLMIYARKTKYRGNVAALYLMLYSIGRPVIELFRDDARGDVGSLSTSQFISIFMLLFSVGFLFYNIKHHAKTQMQVPMNITVFASHGGSDMQAIIDGCKAGKINAKVVAMIGNNADSKAIERAKTEGIDNYFLSHKEITDPDELERKMLDVLESHDTDFIFLAGYMRKLGDNILKQYENRIFNIHPALLPKYGGKGMYGMHVHEAVIAAGEKVSGVTIHRVNEQYDSGAIVAQTEVPVLVGDTAETLAERVLKREHEFLVEIISKIADGEIPLGK